MVNSSMRSGAERAATVDQSGCSSRSSRPIMRITPGRREAPELMMKNPSRHGNTPDPTCDTTPARCAMRPVYWCPMSCASRASIECVAVSKSARSTCSPSPRSFEPCSATIVASAPT